MPARAIGIEPGDIQLGKNVRPLIPKEVFGLTVKGAVGLCNESALDRCVTKAPRHLGLTPNNLTPNKKYARTDALHDASFV